MSTAAASPAYSPGLEGVVAGETAVSSVEDGLRYRGYPVGELADRCSFDEVAYLILHGELPTNDQLRGFLARQADARSLPAPLVTLLRALPKATVPLDALRTSVSVLAHFDPDLTDSSRGGSLLKAERLMAQMPLAVAELYRASKGLPAVEPRPDLGHAAHFLYLVNGRESSPDDVKAFDVSLTLYAEHEFNASTFAARVITSTESDLHAAVAGAIGALKGRLHGGANEKVMDILLAIGGPAGAEAWTHAALAKKERIMGFGHRVYKAGDVRAGILKVYARRAAERAGDLAWEETADAVERVMGAEKKMYPNLDWPAGRLYHALGLEVPLYTPIFALSRITGWAAHVIEQAENNRLIRPRGLYKGPAARTVKPLAERR